MESIHNQQPDSKIYRVRFAGSARLYHGNTPTCFKVHPWPGSAVFEEDEACAKFASDFLASNRFDSESRKVGIPADIAMEDFAIERVELSGAASGKEESKLNFDMIMRVQTKRDVDADALSWMCKQAANWIVPDGGWPTSTERIAFEYQELDWMDAPGEVGARWKSKDEMPPTSRGTPDQWFAAIAADDVEAVRRMVSGGFDPTTRPGENGPRYNVGYQNWDQPNGLWHAAKAGSIGCLRELLKAGVDPMESYYGESALMAARAAPKNGGAVVEALLDAAADRRHELLDRPWRHLGQWSKSPSGDGKTAAMLAAQSGRVEALAAMIKAGAYLDGHDDQNRTIEELASPSCRDLVAAAKAGADPGLTTPLREADAVLARMMGKLRARQPSGAEPPVEKDKPKADPFSG